jgi:hypothetical protein
MLCERSNSELGGWVIHAPNTGTKFVQVRVHLDVVLLINGKRDRHLLKPAVR